MHYICAVITGNMTPLLSEMLHEMQQHLTKEDVRAGLPDSGKTDMDVSPLYVEWVNLQQKARKQMERISELDVEIQRMEPWGDYPMARIDQLAQQGMRLQFWRSTQTQYEGHRSLWREQFQAELISEQGGYCHFVTLSPMEAPLTLPEAQEAQITPSPVSTLIMLQTRAKDSLRQVRLEMGDFSLQHYREVEQALGLSDTLRTESRSRRVLSLFKHIFRSFNLKTQ